MRLKSQHREVIKRCQESALFFMRNFVRIKHPSAGIIRYNPFDYQETAVRSFRKERFVIFRKTRQCGISKVCGIFALWYAMFFSHRTILVVSRRDDDAMSFLRENIKFIFDHLPPWMREVWHPVKDTEHVIQFPNGSIIQSLTSHPDVLRSHASSLNIIDEAAFIQGMDSMWAAGRPTLTHGGSVIVISTTNGVGNWYWNTWTDAEAGLNDFKPLMVHWWDMKWSIKYVDALSGQKREIAPIKDIRECDGSTFEHKDFGKIELDRAKYGPRWSPWLEEQWRGLQEKGEGWKFAQEVLAEFVGSGNTVLPKSVIVHVGTTISDNYEIVTGPQTYVHPVTGEAEELDFTPNEKEEGLWIWKPPVAATPNKVVNGRVVEMGRKAHTYVCGVDIATGKGRDYHAIEIFDLDELEQVAEMMVRCLPKLFKKFVDRVARWYNCALLNIERNNGGDILIDDIRIDFNYPRLWRKTHFVGKTPTRNARMQYAQYGFNTNQSTKPALNKFLLDYVRDKPDEGFKIYSRRLYKQFQIYVRKRDRAGNDTGKTEAESGPGNHDDLVMASAIAMAAVPDAGIMFNSEAMDMFSGKDFNTEKPVLTEPEIAAKFAENQVFMPMVFGPDQMADQSAAAELLKFTSQLGGLPISLAKEQMFVTAEKKHQLDLKRMKRN